jgi:integrase
MRRLMAETTVTQAVGQRLTVEAVAGRYVTHLEAAGRKPSTLAAVRGHLTHRLIPFLGDKAIDKLQADDVRELVRPAPHVRHAAAVAIRTIQEWIGHKDIQTTQRYADYAPSAREAEMIAAAFGRDAIRDGILSEPTVTQEHAAPVTAGTSTH